MSVFHISISAGFFETAKENKKLPDSLGKLPEKSELSFYEEFRFAIQSGFAEFRSSDYQKDLSFLTELSELAPDVLFKILILNLSDFTSAVFFIFNGRLKNKTEPSENVVTDITDIDEAYLRFGISFEDKKLGYLLNNHGLSVRFVPHKSRQEKIFGEFSLVIDGGLNRKCEREYIACDVEAALPENSRNLRDLTFISRPHLSYSSFGYKEKEKIEIFVALKLRDFIGGILPVTDTTDYDNFTGAAQKPV